MAWAIRENSRAPAKRFGRAILSKFGQKISNDVYVANARPILDAILLEAEWCRKRNINIVLEVFRSERQSYIVFD